MKMFKTLLACMVIVSGLSLASSLAAQGRAPMQVSVDQVRSIGNQTEERRFIAHFRQSLSGRVATRIAGAIDILQVRVGDRVARGDLLVAMAGESRKADLNVRKAALAERQSSLAAARASRDLATKELARLKALRGSSAFRQQAFDEKQIELVRLEAEIQRNQALVSGARAGVSQAELSLAWTRITAPFDGVISAVHTSPGDFVQAGAQIVTIQADTGMAIEADVPVVDLPLIASGMVMDIERSNGLYPAGARVKAVVPVENALARTVPVWLDFVAEHRNNPPRVGESLVLKATVTAPKGQLSLHKDAVLWGSTGASVYRVVDGKAESVPVQLGTAIADRFLVLEGVSAGDWLVTRGNERLTPGRQVVAPELSKDADQ